VGRVVNIDAEARVFVDFPGNTCGPLPARMCSAVAGWLQQNCKPPFAPIMLLFEDNDPTRPIAVDYLSEALPDAAAPEQQPLALDIGPDNEVSIDGKTVQFNAEEQVVLKCGKASITLTRAGKVIIRGAYLLNRSSGVNRIKGGSVQIN
jgi:hypothetical protein